MIKRSRRATSAEELTGMDRKGELNHLKVVPLPPERQLPETPEKESTTYPSGDKTTKKDTSKIITIKVIFWNRLHKNTVSQMPVFSTFVWRQARPLFVRLGNKLALKVKYLKNQTIIFLNANENENHFDLIIILLLSTDLQETFPKNHKQKEFYAAVL